MKEEKFVIGFRLAAGKMAYIDGTAKTERGETAYIYGTNDKKKAMRFSKEEAEKILKIAAGRDVIMIKVE